jgi:glycosyltransferase involved in cell wall biosynthesis
MHSRPLHVLMTADAVGGVWTYAQTLVDALAPRGVRFTVAVTGPPPSVTCARRLLAHPHLALVHRPYRLEWMPEADLDVARTGGWLLDLAARVRPDIVHVNGYAHAALPFGVPAIVVAHSCVCSWFTAVKEMAAPVEWRAYRARVAAGLQAAAAVVVPTRTMRAALEHEHGYADALIVPNGLPPRRRTAVAPKEPLVLAAGRLWDEAKGLAVLDAAAAGAPWPVYAAGDLHRPDGAVDAPRHMHALGTLDPDTMQAWMDRAGIFAHPARYEPFGLAPLEAARAGCALVLGDIPSLREVWGDAALYADPTSPSSLRQAIAALAGDAARRERLARAAARRAAEFTSERTGRQYEALYRQLASGAPVTVRAGAASCA